MTPEDIKAVLEAHKKWLDDEEGGVRADLRGASLDGASLDRASLVGANLSGAKGILSASDWLLENFETTADGIIVCKALGKTNYGAPAHWKIEAGEYLTEVVNPCRTADCGCGVNFGTLEWCKKTYPEADLWECLLEWKDLADTVVPYSTDGKARCGRLRLTEIIR